jgi:hypothetical protein
VTCFECMEVITNAMHCPRCHNFGCGHCLDAGGSGCCKDCLAGYLDAGALTHAHTYACLLVAHTRACARPHAHAAALCAVNSLSTEVVGLNPSQPVPLLCLGCPLLSCPVRCAVPLHVCCALLRLRLCCCGDHQGVQWPTLSHALSRNARCNLSLRLTTSPPSLGTGTR